MLATATVREIDRLLKKGELSQRKIAAQLGVSRGIVGAIASGRRGLYGRNPSDDLSCGPPCHVAADALPALWLPHLQAMPHLPRPSASGATIRFEAARSLRSRRLHISGANR